MLEEKILNGYKEAMKNKDALRSSVLSFLRAELINTAIAKKKKSLEDSEVTAVIRKQVKSRQDSIEQFQKGGRQDLVDKETSELAVLKSYLPAELGQEEIKKIIAEAIALTAAQDTKDMGRVMKAAAEKLAGRADAKLVSDLVRERLSKPAS